MRLLKTLDSPPTVMKLSYRNLCASDPFVKKTTIDPYALPALRELSQDTLEIWVLLLSLSLAIRSFLILPPRRTALARTLITLTG